MAQRQISLKGVHGLDIVLPLAVEGINNNLPQQGLLEQWAQCNRVWTHLRRLQRDLMFHLLRNQKFGIGTIRRFLQLLHSRLGPQEIRPGTEPPLATQWDMDLNDLLDNMAIRDKLDLQD